ncbi:bifunctional lysine-specific demethylase and histidyl-hydroxylase NO66 [Drosophila takahashii]|uniref:bifunctional lysine-specific demethylase and histidyl-hydroxylase NO66 n=1 Tax=Drosophila takahashii TaxID=29030 RepID=UPI001CF81127|nr:bifunctional lysine-specific demethylase and histidyl-hydroxylase NO66 [Drosophila takahashii]
MSMELWNSEKASRKSKDLSLASMDDLVKQVFDKSKELSMSIKDQRKLVKKYMNAKIEGSDESDSNSNGDSESEGGSYSSSEEDSNSDSDKETEESSDKSEPGSSEDEKGTPFEATQKQGNPETKFSRVEPELTRLVEHVPPSKFSSSQPASRIQRRITMAGGLVASPLRNSAPSIKVPKSAEAKSFPISNKVKVTPRLEKQEPSRKPSINCLVKPKDSSFSEGKNNPIIRLPDPRS